MTIRIISGGQSGVDRGALEAALAGGIPCGGWCPAGRIAEDGPIADRYPLEETPCSDYEERTIWNVADAEVTLVLNEGELEGGTLYTVRAAEQLARPVIMVDLTRLDGEEGWRREASRIGRRIEREGWRMLNVAGPRESKRPGIGERARRFVALLLEEIAR